MPEPTRFPLRLPSSFAFTLILALAPAFASGQVPAKAPAQKIGSLSVSGQRRLSRDQILAAAALHAGDRFDVKELNHAAEILGKSGLFEEVTYSYLPQDQLVSVEFKVQETVKFRRCTFDNFVWFADGELQMLLQRIVPLFIGELPETGQVLDDIARALEQLSQEKGLTVHVDRRIDQSSILDPNWGHLFVASGPQVTAQSVSFTGQFTANLQDLQRQAAVLIGKEYSIARCRSFTGAVLGPFYRERGYLRATADPAARVVGHAPGSDVFSVEVVFTMSEGTAYRWAPTEWVENQQLSAVELDALSDIKPGSAASEKKITAAWDAIKRAYAKRGFLEAKFTPEPAFDDAKGEVRYRVTFSEGPQYRMGTLQVLGISDQLADRLKGKWRLKSGEIFDGSYPAEFASKEAAAALQGNLRRFTHIGIKTELNQEQRVANVTFQAE
jgi:outer membrane protein assembly factor BamA